MPRVEASIGVWIVRKSESGSRALRDSTNVTF
jgi:hypothetical protein